MTDDTKLVDDTTPEDKGSATTPETKGSGVDDAIVSARKRQAGAEAARQIAEAKAADLERELAKYREAGQTAAEKDLTELARTKAQLEAAEKKAADAEALANAKYLDKVFPNARKELPELTDEVRLAKFEAMLADGDFEPPTPAAPDARRSPSGGGAPAKPETAAEIRARLEAMPLDW